MGQKMIEEQIKKLREEAERQSKSRSMTRRVFSRMFAQAADTIEALSAKLQAANVERSAECGGWIYCGDGRNFPKKSGEYIVMIENATLPTALHFLNTDNSWFDLDRDYKVVAWMKFPEPYHEP